MRNVYLHCYIMVSLLNVLCISRSEVVNFGQVRDLRGFRAEWLQHPNLCTELTGGSVHVFDLMKPRAIANQMWLNQSALAHLGSRA